MISMSMHAKTRDKLEAIEMYLEYTGSLFNKLCTVHKNWHNPTLRPIEKDNGIEAKKTLIIMAGSQKGLCGNFNTNIAQFCHRELNKLKIQPAHVVAVGKKLADIVKDQFGENSVTQYAQFSHRTVPQISQELVEMITSEGDYNSIFICNNESETFFKYRQQITPLTLMEPNLLHGRTKTDVENYEWEQSPDETITSVAKLYMETKIYRALMSNLMAEQATRFISMDSATRNAETMLDEMQLKYNKLRQAKITQELAELSGSL